MSYCKAGFACLCSMRESFDCENMAEGDPPPEHLAKQREHYAKIDARRKVARVPTLASAGRMLRSLRQARKSDGTKEK